MALLSKLREWEGLHEVKDKETLMGYFRQAGFEFNPVTDPWCGAGLRAALVLSGYKDPGLAGHKASNYAELWYAMRASDWCDLVWSRALRCSYRERPNHRVQSIGHGVRATRQVLRHSTRFRDASSLTNKGGRVC